MRPTVGRCSRSPLPERAGLLAIVVDVVVPCAQLRVFVPTDSLGPRDRERWAPEAALGLREARRVEDTVARLRLLTGRGAAPDDAVLVRRSGRTQFVCPLQYDVRAAAGLRMLRDTVPSPVVDLLLGGDDLSARLDSAAAAGGVPTIVDAPWAIPLPWFVLFTDDERHFLAPPEGAGPRLLYLTTVAAALTRIDRTLDALDVVEDGEVLFEELAELSEWLETFDERSLLELDYAGLARVLGTERLEADRSVRDAWAAIDGLEAGDMLSAVAYYGALRGRWSRLRAQPTAS